MADTRKANLNWRVVNEDGQTFGNYDAAKMAVLMDIRDELQKLNRIFRCPNFLAIPSKLDMIRRNTAKPRKRIARKQP